MSEDEKKKLAALFPDVKAEGRVCPKCKESPDRIKNELDSAFRHWHPECAARALAGTPE